MELKRTVIINYFKESGKWALDIEIKVPFDDQLYQVIDTLNKCVFSNYSFPYAIMTAKDPDDSILCPHLFIKGK